MESRNLSHQYNDDFAQFTLYSLYVCQWATAHGIPSPTKKRLKVDPFSLIWSLMCGENPDMYCTLYKAFKALIEQNWILIIPDRRKNLFYFLIWYFKHKIDMLHWILDNLVSSSVRTFAGQWAWCIWKEVSPEKMKNILILFIRSRMVKLEWLATNVLFISGWLWCHSWLLIFRN